MINPDLSIKPDLPELVQNLKDLNRHITIETAGIAYMPDMPCDLMSISPKLSNSTPKDRQLATIHEKSRLDTAVLGALIDNYEYQLKFVVECESDFGGDTRDFRRNKRRESGKRYAYAPGRNKKRSARQVAYGRSIVQTHRIRILPASPNPLVGQPESKIALICLWTTTRLSTGARLKTTT